MKIGTWIFEEKKNETALDHEWFFFVILDIGAIDTRWTGMEVCFLSFYVNGMSENCIHNS